MMKQTRKPPAGTGAADAYNQILERHRPDAPEMRQAIYAAERLQKCTFGTDPVPTTLSPHFLTTSQIAHIRRVTTTVMQCVEKVVRFYFEHPEARDFIRLNEMERFLIDIDPRMTRVVFKSRMDSFLCGRTRLRFTEINCDSPAGMAYCDVQEAIFKKLPPMKALGRKYRFVGKNRTTALLFALLTAYKDFGGKRARPNIAVTDWRTVKTQPEFQLVQDVFQARGFNTVVVDPRDFDFHRGKLYAPDGTRIDLIYRRVITRELAEKEKDCRALIDAVSRHKVCIANPFRSKVVANKSTLAVLSDPGFNKLFTPSELKILRASVPWTRNFEPGRVIYKGKKHDIADLAAKRRKDMVLKPADGYGGKDVFIGHVTSAGDWTGAIHRALGNNWVLQEFIPPPIEAYPVITKKGKMVYRSFHVNLNPFVFGGRYGGCITRLSLKPIVNVTAGGAMVPTVTVDRK